MKWPADIDRAVDRARLSMFYGAGKGNTLISVRHCDLELLIEGAEKSKLLISVAEDLGFTTAQLRDLEERVALVRRLLAP